MSQIKLRSQLQRGDFKLDFELSIPETGITVLFGPSGSGKTTLLRMLAGLEQYDQTQMSWGDEVWQSDETFVPCYDRDIGMVFQTPRLFPHLNVRQNLRYGMTRAGNPASEYEFNELIRLLGLSSMLEREPASLSGGQQQRVAIARALLMQPSLLLMDEPLSALDAKNKAEILPYLERLHQELRIPLVYVTHDLTEMARLGDSLVLLDEGQVIAAGPMSSLLTDPDLPLANRQDACMQFDLPVVSSDREYGLCELRFNDRVNLEFACTSSTPGSLRRVLIQAEDITLSNKRHKTSALNQIPVFVRESWSVGSSHEHVLLETIGDQLLIARITRKSARELGIEVGSTLIASVKTSALRGSIR